MSLTIGSSGKNLNELIASMLAQMNGTASSPTPAATTPSATPPATSTTPASAPSSTTKNVVVGSGKASYSNEIMGLFSRMHQSVSAPSGNSSTSSSSATTTTTASATTLATPIDSILSPIDTENDTTTAAATASTTDPDASDSDASDAGPSNAHMRAIRPDA